jgi:hypothetical protein
MGRASRHHLQRRLRPLLCEHGRPRRRGAWGGASRPIGRRAQCRGVLDRLLRAGRPGAGAAALDGDRRRLARDPGRRRLSGLAQPCGGRCRRGRADLRRNPAADQAGADPGRSCRRVRDGAVERAGDLDRHRGRVGANLRGAQPEIPVPGDSEGGSGLSGAGDRTGPRDPHRPAERPARFGRQRRRPAARAAGDDGERCQSRS